MPTRPVSVYCEAKEYTEYAIPRGSRISWKSRDDAEPPRIASSSDAAKRRRSEREIPGAARHTWYCSVSFCWNRRRGGGACTRGGRALDELDDATVLDVPRRGDDDVRGDVHRVVVAGDRVARDRRDHLRRSDHGPAERVVAEHRLGDQVVNEVLRRV